ncbi:RBBP8 N-terminal-like protein isoform X3 [Megalops cyprinoides]|uniref:RBBP8 N-terminal-like protein isoform X3 n=1 Tax=Megalops cyprinoides TaxID=118141 RepID=UPI001863ABAB|nr:RBBP8 N-terminal-like protein isoform X3 [Megalops cyprinoides]
MALDSFTELLHKLKDLHEREIEGWQEKVLELTNQRCCSDTKRMEELFNKNQLLREQQRVLTENIKQLENRLRAGLCDRCTVTQDVAKRRQQEYETLQIQSLQHITVLANEINALKKENKILQEEVKNLQSVLDGQNSQGPKIPTPEVGQSHAPSASAIALITAAMKAGKQPQGGATAGLTTVKTDPDHSSFSGTEEKLPAYRKSQSWNGQETHVSHKIHIATPISPGQTAEQSIARNIAGEKRVHSAEAMESQLSPRSPSFSSPMVFVKNPAFSSSPTMGDEKPAHPLLHAPVPCRPRPIKTARLSLPWPLPEQSDWAALVPTCSIGGGLQQAPLLAEHNRSLLPGKDQSQTRKRGPEPQWAERSAPHLHSSAMPIKRTMSAEQVERRDRAEGRGTAQPWWKSSTGQAQRIFGENLRDGEADGPLDLSDPGKSKPSEQQQSHKLSLISQEEAAAEEEASGKMDPRPQASPGSSSSSSSAPAPSSPSSTRSTTSPQQENAQNMEEQDTLDKDESMEDKQEVNPELSDNAEEKKVPILTISLHPDNPGHPSRQQTGWTGGRCDVVSRKEPEWREENKRAEHRKRDAASAIPKGQEGEDESRTAGQVPKRRGAELTSCAQGQINAQQGNGVYR